MDAGRVSFRPTIPQLRLTTGLIVGLYVTMHLANHSLGLISVDAQEMARPYVMAIWHSAIGQLLLYGSLTFHACLGLWALVRRRLYRIPLWEGVQLTLGLAIPYFLLLHIVNTRGTRVLTHIDIDYVYEITNLWVSPASRIRQLLLVTLVWTHFAIGLHFWLRLQSWYRRAFAMMLLAYVLIPFGALAGFAEVGMTMTAHARSDPAWYSSVQKHGVPADKSRAKLRATLKAEVGQIWLGIIVLTFSFAQVRNWVERKRLFTLTYADARVRAPIGMSILEVSRMARRPHLSVCGGRARCTTCRVRVLECHGSLPAPNLLEARALSRIGAPPGMRLACQTRPECDLMIQPLLDAHFAARAPRSASEFGEERALTVLFLDLRESTRLAEKHMPFDIVFIFNYLMAEMAAAVESSGGYYSNFTGDGLMALFGLRPVPDHGAKAALQCTAEMLERLNAVNKRLSHQLDAPLRLGIGVHTGVAIVGRMGSPAHPVLTAIGDSVNIAARLQEVCKETLAPAMVSAATLATLGAGLPPMHWHELPIRGRVKTLRAAAMDTATLKAVFHHSNAKSAVAAS